MKQLLIHEEAEREFGHAVDYYEECSVGLGMEFAHEVERCFSAIRQNPMRFAPYKHTPLQRCVTKRFPFNIFFRELEEHISIVAIAHAKRRPEYWKGRSSS